MTSSFKLASLVVSAAFVVTAGCSSSTLNPTGTGGSPATGGSPGTGGVPATGGSPGTGGAPATGGAPGVGGCTGAVKAGEVPAEHRAVATTCAPSTQRPPAPDAGLLSCTKDSDCAVDGAATLFNTCLHGQCSFDQCLTDADCGPTGVCGCSTDYYGGNTAYHSNVCVPANCRVDSDCGPSGYCSPSRGHCGSFMGFYCHTAADTCVDPTHDCTPCGSGASCVYAPTTASFVCGSVVCGG